MNYYFFEALLFRHRRVRDVRARNRQRGVRPPRPRRRLLPRLLRAEGPAHRKLQSKHHRRYNDDDAVDDDVETNYDNAR